MGNKTEIRRKKEAIKVAKRLRDKAETDGVRRYWKVVIRRLKADLEQLEKG